MPLTEEEWIRLKRNVDHFFRDVGRDLAIIAREAQAVLRVLEGGDGRTVPGSLGLVLELSSETIVERVRSVERRLTLFERDVEDLREGEEL